MSTATAIIGTIARPALRAGVSASSVPVDIVGRVVGQHGNDEWPPALVVQGLQATVLETAGSLLHDEALRSQGRLLAEKVDRLRVAADLEAEAEVKREQADAERAERKQEIARKQQQAAQAAKEQKAAAARRAEEQKRAAREEAAEQAAEAREAREDAEQRVEQQARVARTRSIATERKAVAKEKAAATAARKAAATDAAIKATNQARRS